MLKKVKITIFFVYLLLAIAIEAGPPFQTDDPQPVEFRHWEAYFASQITRSADGVTGAAPEIEVNYGMLPQMQAHIILPLAFSTPMGDSSFYGFGDVEIGVKYRFINEENVKPQIGIFPHLEYPLGNQSHGLGTGHVRIFLPLWLQKSQGPWTTYGGGGYWVDTKNGANNSWFFGWELQRDLSITIALGTELFMNTPGWATAETEIGSDVGTIVNISDNHHVLASLGRDFSGANTIAGYAAYQFTFGDASN
jgi:hypothetical protein